MNEPCKFEDRIITMSEDISSIKSTVQALDRRINGSIDDIKTHIGHGTKWRLSIVGVGASLLIFMGTVVHWSGRICEKVEHHDKQLRSLKVSDHTARSETNS
jgi:hypothetical protein